MRPRRRFLETLTLALLAFLMIGLGSAFAQGNGKGKPPKDDGGGGSPSINVEYEVFWLGTLGGTYSSVQAANSHGDLVGLATDANGLRHATRFTPSGPLDLNEEMAVLLAARTDGQWHVWIANGINDHGQITGGIVDFGQPVGSGRTYPFIYDPNDYTLVILEQIDGTDVWSVDINNFGQIVGQYFVYSPVGPMIDMSPRSIGGNAESPLNDAGQIAFSSERYTPDSYLGGPGTYEVFPGGLTAINDQGVVAGGYRTETNKGGTKFISAIYRATDPGNIQVLYEGSSAGPSRINDHDDVCFTGDDRLILYRDGVELVHLDAYVVGEATSVTKWLGTDYVIARTLLNPSVNDDGTVGYPVIAGTANMPGLGESSEAFVLVPSTIP